MRIEIVVESAQPLCGRVRTEGGPPLAFSGWLPLLRILERLTSLDDPAPQRLGDQLHP